MQGEVVWFDVTRGIGFIKPHDGGKDVFVHSSQARRAGIELRDRDRVEFDIEADRQGRLAAVNLKLTEERTTHTGGHV